jgi:serine/threonine protein kinase
MSSGAPTAAAAPRRHSASVYGATVDSGSGPADPREVGLAPGTRVHQFEIIRELGRGGMGQVVLARDTKLARLVALKFLALDGPRFVERFLVEARATARCQHEHIVVIYEADEWHGVPYMALEYLEGRSLADHLVDGPLPVARAVELMTAVVRALARAHDHHLVHCDLKPDNIFVTTDGVVKVLDFGIARLFTHNADGERLRAMQRELKRGLPSEALLDDPSSVAGTPPYMAFEQWGTEPIDHRTDLWAVGIIFWELIGGRHPLGTPTMPRILDAVANLDVPMPSIATACPDLAPALVAVIDRCLAKRKDGRFADARALLRALDAATSAAVADDDRPPFPGMAAFQEADAKRFFGREREVQAASARLAQLPLVVLAGPSGVGKSSFVRAGLVPALRAAGRWQVVTLRPGRDPLGALVAALAPLGGLGDDAATRLMTEPGLIGEHLRAHARARDEHVLVYVDQFEETFTLGADAAARAAFVAALTGIADDAASPLRLVVSIRADFLDRLGDEPVFLERATRGLIFLRPLDRGGLRAALELPLAATGHRFEDGVVDAMVASLDAAPGALPLLQFAAATLWDRRDRARRVVTAASYAELGGLAGALANHAEGVVAGLSPSRQRLLRTLALRLVTPDGTRALLEQREAEQLGAPAEVRGLIAELVAARLLAAEQRGDDATIELVHESLLTAWPTLRRWREESGEDAAILDQVRSAAKQWDQRGRPVGLLWTGDSLDEIRTFRRRYQAPLPAREEAFLDAAMALGARAARRRRRLLGAALVGLSAMVAAAAIALVLIRGAERAAQDQRAEAERAAVRAQAAEVESRQRLAAFEEAERQRRAADEQRQAAEASAASAAAAQQAAQSSLAAAQGEVAQSREELEAANGRLKVALAEATAARTRAEEATRKAEAAAVKLREAVAEQRARAEKAEQAGKGLAKTLR